MLKIWNIVVRLKVNMNAILHQLKCRKSIGTIKPLDILFNISKTGSNTTVAHRGHTPIHIPHNGNLQPSRGHRTIQVVINIVPQFVEYKLFTQSAKLKLWSKDFQYRIIGYTLLLCRKFEVPCVLITYHNQVFIISIALYFCELNMLCFCHRIECLLLCLVIMFVSIALGVRSRWWEGNIPAYLKLFHLIYIFTIRLLSSLGWANMNKWLRKLFCKSRVLNLNTVNS